MPTEQPVPKAPVAALSAHALVVTTALLGAIFWPQAGEAAVLVPISPSNSSAALEWLGSEDASLLDVSANGEMLIVSIPSGGSVLRAIGQGILPLSVESPAC